MKNQSLSVQSQIPLLMSGFICLACIMGSGLLRLGWSLAETPNSLVSLHRLTQTLGLPWVIGATLITMANIIFSIATAHIFYRQRTLFALTILLSGISWLLGNILWISYLSMAQVAPWWITLLVLTVVVEWLELSRIHLPTSISKIIFILIITLFLVGIVLIT